MWQAWNANRNFVVFLKTKIYNRRKVLICNFHKKLFKVIREKATSICKLRFVDQIRALKRLDEFPTRFSDVLLNKIEKNFFSKKHQIIRTIFIFYLFIPFFNIMWLAFMIIQSKLSIYFISNTDIIG